MRRRRPELDLLRCLAMVLVVSLHTIAPILGDVELYQTGVWRLCMGLDTINRMGVPLFFMLSGCLILNHSATRSIGSFYQKHLLRLLVPLIVWNGIYGIWYEWRSGGEIAGIEILKAQVRQGVSSHMWFVYVLLGFYLLAPFLYRAVVECTDGQLLILLAVVLFYPTFCPILNAILPVDFYLFGPIVEGCLGYVLMGCWLGRKQFSRRERMALYLLGLLGYLWGTLGNLAAASPKEIPLPMDGGYCLHHYLTSGAVFVWVQTFCSRHVLCGTRRASILAHISDLTFGVYWVHVLVLEWVTEKLGASPLAWQSLGIGLGMTIGISLLFSEVAAKHPGIRRLLMG